MSGLRRRLRRPALVLLTVNAALFAVYTLPRSLGERSIASRVALLRAEVARERGQVEALRRRAETMRANAKDQERFSREILKSREATLLPVLAEIHTAAREEGIALGREDYQPSEVKGSSFTRLAVRLPVNGSYRELVAFLGRLERAKHFLVVDEVHLRERSERGLASLDIVLSTYFQAPAGGGGA